MPESPDGTRRSSTCRARVRRCIGSSVLGAGSAFRVQQKNRRAMMPRHRAIERARAADLATQVRSKRCIGRRGIFAEDQLNASHFRFRRLQAIRGCCPPLRRRGLLVKRSSRSLRHRLWQCFRSWVAPQTSLSRECLRRSLPRNRRGSQRAHCSRCTSARPGSALSCRGPSVLVRAPALISRLAVPVVEVLTRALRGAKHSRSIS